MSFRGVFLTGRTPGSLGEVIVMNLAGCVRLSVRASAPLRQCGKCKSVSTRSSCSCPSKRRRRR